MEMTLGTTVIYLASCAMSALIQSVSGFGFAIFMMSVIPNFMPYSTCTVVSGLLSLGTNVANVTRYRKSINWKLIIVPAISYFIVSYLVINFAAGSSDATLKKILGVVLIILSIYFLFFSSRIKIRPTKRNGTIAGALSGVMGGLFSMSGPPIVVYMLSTNTEKEEYLGTIQTFFLITNVYTSVLRILKGMVTLEMLGLVVVGMLCSGLGFVVGVRLLKRIDAAMLKKIIYGFMAISGLSMILR